MAEVSLSKVVKNYGDVCAVKGIDLHIKDKEFLVLVGPSGCGKSTTLRMIAGLEEISDGEISIGAKVVNRVHPKDRDIAMVFQSYALYPHMNVFDNMAFGLQLRKMPKQEITARVEQAASILGLTEYLQRKPKELSGGQRQRVAMGRAIVRRPAVFLFDEPLSNLDAKLRVQMRTEIARLHARLQSTSVYVTHDQVEAMTLADRIVVMKDGLIQQVGSPMELYTKPANMFVATFIGSPSMNLIHGEVEQQDGQKVFQSPNFQRALKGKQWKKIPNSRKVVLGIRPQGISLCKEQGDSREPCSIDVIEPLGAETFLHMGISDENTVIVKEENYSQKKPGEDYYLQFNDEFIHFFDAETGQRIS